MTLLDSLPEQTSSPFRKTANTTLSFLLFLNNISYRTVTLQKLFLLIIGFLFFDCEDNEPQDKLSPQIVFDSTVFTKADFIAGTITVNAEAKDDSDISQFQLLVDGEVIHEVSGKIFSFLWNTSMVSNGDHNLVLKAIDEFGNEGGWSDIVTVINDDVSPVLQLSSPDDNVPFIKGIFKIEATASDDTGVDRIIFSVNGEQVTEAEGNDLSFSWDTREVNDGVHTITVTAVDKTGNSKMIDQQVKILNYFITLRPNFTSVPIGVDLWYYIADSNGNVVDVVEYHSGMEEVQFVTPDNFKETNGYTLAEFYHVDRLGDIDRDESSVVFTPGFFMGDYTVNEPSIYLGSQPERVLGVHNLKVINQEGDGYRIFGDFETFTLNELFPLELDLFLIEEPADVTLLWNNETLPMPLYKIIRDLRVGESTVVDFGSLSALSGTRVAAHPDATSLLSMVLGLDNDSKLERPTIWFNFKSDLTTTSNQHEFFHAREEFAKYYFFSAESSSEFAYGMTVIAAEAPVEFIRNDGKLLDFVLEGRDVTIRSSGSFDVQNLYGAKTVVRTDQNLDQFWSIQLPPADAVTFTLPEIPSEINGRYNFPSADELVFTNVSYWDYTEVSSFDNYFAHMFGGGDREMLFQNVNNSVALPTSSSGRKSAHSFKTTNDLLLERLARKLRGRAF